MVQITGLVHKSGSPGKTISAATVVAREAMKTAVTNNEGRYSISNISQGKYTFQVLVSGKVVRELQVSIPSASYDLAV